MASPTEWAERLTLETKMRDRKLAVLAEVKLFLEAHAGTTFTTTQLVEGLYPEWLARGDGLLVRQRLFAALLAVADEDAAKPVAVRQEARAGKFGKAIRPVIWTAPRKAEPPQRYDFEPSDGDPNVWTSYPYKDGPWVRWEDVEEFFK